MGRARLGVGGERFSRPRFSGKVSDSGVANGGTHFSRPHRQATGGRSMNGQFRARLMLCSKWLRCRRTDARKRVHQAGHYGPAYSTSTRRPLRLHPRSARAPRGPALPHDLSSRRLVAPSTIGVESASRFPSRDHHGSKLVSVPERHVGLVASAAQAEPVVAVVADDEGGKAVTKGRRREWREDSASYCSAMV
jgi:hypothetical protein